jgi:uncharacterized protein YdaU (DUF1376 family)
MPFYVADYLADTRHLSAEEHGAYLLLIMHYWQHGKLPQSDAMLSRIAASSRAKWKQIRPVIAKFFTDDWRHGRIDRELAAAEVKHHRRVGAGKAGGIAKATKLAKAKQSSSNATPLPLAKAKQSSSNALASSSQPYTVVANAPTAADAASYPIDPTERLWAEGLDVLLDMEVSPKQARANIGRWLKDHRDPATVLGAILQARTIGSKDPIPLITRILKPLRNGGQNHDGATSVHRAAHRLLDKFRELAGDDDADPPDDGTRSG